MIYKNILETIGNTPLVVYNNKILLKLESFNPSGSIKDRAAYNMIKSALDRLPAQYQQVIEMNYYEDLSQREISERLGVSQMQVSRILKKAITELFEIVKDTNEDVKVAN